MHISTACQTVRNTVLSCKISWKTSKKRLLHFDGLKTNSVPLSQTLEEQYRMEVSTLRIFAVSSADCPRRTGSQFNAPCGSLPKYTCFWQASIVARCSLAALQIYWDYKTSIKRGRKGHSNIWAHWGGEWPMLYFLCILGLLSMGNVRPNQQSLIYQQWGFDIYRRRLWCRNDLERKNYSNISNF